MFLLERILVAASFPCEIPLSRSPSWMGGEVQQAFSLVFVQGAWG